MLLVRLIVRKILEGEDKVYIEIFLYFKIVMRNVIFKEVGFDFVFDFLFYFILYVLLNIFLGIILLK